MKKKKGREKEIGKGRKDEGRRRKGRREGKEIGENKGTKKKGTEQ